MAPLKRVLVGVKRVIDYAVRVRVDKTGSGVELANTKMSMNPFCEIAVEEAIQLKEKGLADEVVAVSIGPKQAQETLRSALAMGADKAVHVATDVRLDQELNPLAVAQLLQKVVEAQEPDLVIVGKQSIDGDNATTAPMLAELLGWSQATFAAGVDVAADGATAEVERETDAGTETVKVSLPAVISADLRLNTPRYPKLPNIMKAKKKPLDQLAAADLGVDLAPSIVVESVAAPPDRAAGITVDSVDALVDKLKNEAAVI
jgi:electron transfer flavoprotein beta subunit